MKIKLDKGAIMPTRAHDTDAGLDLYCREDKMLWAGQSVRFDTGVHIELPHGYFGKIESKSGLNVDHGVVCLGGVIDEGYTGSIVVKLYSCGATSHKFLKGDKIAQLVILPYLAPDLEEVEELEQSDRGSDGFGSTGR